MLLLTTHSPPLHYVICERPPRKKISPLRIVLSKRACFVGMSLMQQHVDEASGSTNVMKH